LRNGVPDGIRKYVEAKIGRGFCEGASLVAPTDGVTTAPALSGHQDSAVPTFLTISPTRGNLIQNGAPNCPRNGRVERYMWLRFVTA
jgi:hypothetical protein